MRWSGGGCISDQGRPLNVNGGELVMKVYCDTGAYSHDLRDMERLGEIKVFQFKYENRNKRIKNIATPSQPTWEQAKYSWSELGGLTSADAGRR